MKREGEGELGTQEYSVIEKSCFTKTVLHSAETTNHSDVRNPELR